MQIMKNKSEWFIQFQWLKTNESDDGNTFICQIHKKKCMQMRANPLRYQRKIILKLKPTKTIIWMTYLSQPKINQPFSKYIVHVLWVFCKCDWINRHSVCLFSDQSFLYEWHAGFVMRCQQFHLETRIAGIVPSVNNIMDLQRLNSQPVIHVQLYWGYDV